MTLAQEPSLEQIIASKLMVDIRFFAEAGEPEAVLSLPATLAAGLTALAPCGVILFAENVASVKQCRALTDQIRAVLGSAEAPPLISIDQEGGRVVRLPREQATSFTGNMAIAACPPDQRLALAEQMAAAQAQELAALGININFAPTLDVNSNPANPVIQVRSFGDDPAVVAALGAAVVRGTQQAGVAACPKHFPGHGDTSVDSHVGLPRVDHSYDRARAMDLAPFEAVFQSAPPALVMTAHIQYPCLDDTMLPGTDVVCPATLSRTIITDVLRAKLGYQGVVISDALDMHAISRLLSPEEAVVACFRAGVDIALMPLLVRSAQDITALQALVANVARRVRAGELDEAELRASASRVVQLQQAYGAVPRANLEMLGCAGHRQVEARIATASITCLGDAATAALPTGARVHLVLPDSASVAALKQSLLARRPDLALTGSALAGVDLDAQRMRIAEAEVVVVGIAEPNSDSVVVAGGAEDLGGVAGMSPLALQKQLLHEAGHATRIVLLLRAPYVATELAGLADCQLASYDGAAVGAGGEPGPAYVALAQVLAGRTEAKGQLPVALGGSSPV
jgi:beta-N-acetylhexosaminidase